jgi:(p)ppGpp synthase/HD superfamily hydrolase
MNHLLEVASLVTEATGGTEPSIVIAALLHDAIEDQEVVCTENLNPDVVMVKAAEDRV